MHSSRMRTARSSSSPGGSPPVTPRTRHPPGTRHPLWTKWQTGVNILPCTKLRLRAVIKHWSPESCFVWFCGVMWMMTYNHVTRISHRRTSSRLKVQKLRDQSEESIRSGYGVGRHWVRSYMAWDINGAYARCTECVRTAGGWGWQYWFKSM